MSAKLIPQLRAHNHYVPCVYLKGFASPDGQIFRYGTLVSHTGVHLWKKASIKAIAKYSHLYTRIVAGAETDEIERWLDSEFEASAAEPLCKAISGSRLSATDWCRLVDFTASQIVRTPAFWVRNLLPCLQAETPALLNSVLEDSVQKTKDAKQSGEPITTRSRDGLFTEYLPIHVTVKPNPSEGTSQLQATTVVGRAMWLFFMQRTLPEWAEQLQQQRWSILSACDGLPWITSADPVVRLDYFSETCYGFNVGMGRTGTEIFFPISRRHLLYTRIGHNPPAKGDTLPANYCNRIRRLTARHAYRWVFAQSEDRDVAAYHPRIVDAGIFQMEKEGWSNWHKDQTAAELRLTNLSPE